MLSLNSLSAFTQEVARNAGIQPVRGTDRADAARNQAPAQRILQSAPPAGSERKEARGHLILQSVPRSCRALPASGTLPRGSLLDLRV